jgi:ABC-2 type transport system permease protein
MRQIFLIARREYFAFVTAWGFWVSLLILPFLITVFGFGIPALIEGTQPTRYYAVVAEDPALEAAFVKGLANGRNEALEGVVRAAARARGADQETTRRALAAYAAAESEEAGLAAAIEVLGLPGMSALQIPEFPMVRVDPPATDAESLRPYLLGEATVDTPEGPRPLFAAVVLRRDAGGVGIDYWSSNLSDRTLIGLAERAMRDLMRSEALNELGVPPDAVERAVTLQPALTELNPKREAGRAEVTLADRLPLYMGVGAGFFLWMVVFTGAQFLLTGVIEEKGAKILEALLASARYHEILVGKLFGVAAVSATTFLVWAVFIALGVGSLGRVIALLPGEVTAIAFDPGLLIPFAAYLVLGYLMFGAIYAAIGSLCETIQEAQTLMLPMMFVTMPPLFMMMVALNAPDSPALAVMSWVPVYTPFLMMMRLPLGVPLWEVIGTMVLLAAFAAFVIMAAGGVFRAGVVGGAKADSVKRFFAGLRRRPGAADASQPAE